MEITVVQNKDYKEFIDESDYETEVVKKLTNRNTKIESSKMVK